jgi:hypothetical protein
MRPRSSALPRRRALAEERRDALARVLAREDLRERLLLGLQALVEIGVPGNALDLADGDRRLSGQLARPRQRGVEELMVGAVPRPQIESAIDRYLGSTRGSARGAVRA